MYRVYVTWYYVCVCLCATFQEPPVFHRMKKNHSRRKQMNYYVDVLAAHSHGCKRMRPHVVAVVGYLCRFNIGRSLDCQCVPFHNVRSLMFLSFLAYFAVLVGDFLLFCRLSALRHSFSLALCLSLSLTE